MIVTFVLGVIFSVMQVLLVLNMPPLPEEVYNFIDQGFTYIIAGGGILSNYTPLGYLLTLFFVILAIDAGIMIYHFVMWIIRKIPFIGSE